METEGKMQTAHFSTESLESWYHFHHWANRKQANRSVIQANLSDVQVNLSNIQANQSADLTPTDVSNPA